VEKKQLERAMGFEDLVKEARWAAESHRVTRQWVKTTLKEGDLMTDICERIENKTRSLLGPSASPFNSGIAFPTGCSINHVAAHYSPNTGDMTRLQRNDLVKFDYGTPVNGRIIDSAFTFSLNPDRYETLIKAAQAATETGIREAGIDARLGEIGAAIQETMESFEIELDGKTYRPRP